MTQAVNSTQLGWRSYHSSELMGDNLIIWGGNQDGLPMVHDSEKKRSFTTKMSILNWPTMEWSNVSTTGTPPAGATEYNTTTIGEELYVFGGKCGKCCHNDLYKLNTRNRIWRAIPAITTDSPMKKCSCGFVSYSCQGSDYLLTIGGVGGKHAAQPPSNPQLNALYIPLFGNEYYTNEVYLMDVTTSPGKWISPTITGDKPPPIAYCTLNTLSTDRSKAVLFGGQIIPKKTEYVYSNDVYILSLATDTVNFAKIYQRTNEYPKPRAHHSSTIITSEADDHLLIIGGRGPGPVTIPDCWIMNMTTKIFSKIDLPEAVCGRWYHSVSSVTINTKAKWIIVSGGLAMNYDAIQGDEITMIVEMEYENSKWLVQGIWSSCQKPALLKRLKELQLPIEKILSEMIENLGLAKKQEQKEPHHEEELADKTGKQNDAHIGVQPPQIADTKDQQFQQQLKKAQQERDEAIQQIIFQRQKLEKFEQKVNDDLRSILEENHKLKCQLDKAYHEKEKEQQKLKAMQLKNDQEIEIYRKELEDEKLKNELKNELMQKKRDEEFSRLWEQIEYAHKEKDKAIQLMRLQQQPNYHKFKAELEREREAVQQKDCVIQQQADTIRQLNEEIKRKDMVIRNNDSVVKKQVETIQQVTQKLTQLQKENQSIIAQNATNNIQKDKQIERLQILIRTNDEAFIHQQQEIARYRNNPHWLIHEGEVEMTREILGTGGWGQVTVGIFRGTRVAVKCLHQLIISDYNRQLFTREMDIASRVRHPNLLLFIGATKVGNPLILTELMPTSLRKQLEMSPMTKPQVIAIGIDVASALNYLHCFKPHPILHRDVSSANVLLEPSGRALWKAKVSDYGSANLLDNIQTVNPGSPVYSAPEANNPSQHSPAMDVYSLGILVVEMTTGQFPANKMYERVAQIASVKWQNVKELIQLCTSQDPTLRPSTYNILQRLKQL